MKKMKELKYSGTANYFYWYYNNIDNGNKDLFVKILKDGYVQFSYNKWLFTSRNYHEISDFLHGFLCAKINYHAFDKYTSERFLSHTLQVHPIYF